MGSIFFRRNGMAKELSCKRSEGVRGATLKTYHNFESNSEFSTVALPTTDNKRVERN